MQIERSSPNLGRSRTAVASVLWATLIFTFTVCVLPAASQGVRGSVPLGNVGQSTPSSTQLWQQSQTASQIGDLIKTREFSRSACLSGAAIACSRMGELFASDLLGPPSQPQAANFFDIGCQLGNANACHAIGLMLIQGIGIGADILAGRKALQTSCDNGNTMGCTNLGLIVSGGVYGPVDCKLAHTLFQRAVELWSDNTQAKIGFRQTDASLC